MHSPGLTVHLIVVARCDRPSQSIVQHAHSCSYYSSVAPTATAKEIRTKYMHLARASAAHPGLPDGIISTDDEDEDDNDADDGGATKLLPHVYSFFGSASQAPADDAEWELPVATPASHAPSHATALSSSGATSVTTSAPASVGGRGSTRRPPLPTQRSHSRSRRPWPSSGRGHPADRGDRCCALRASPHQCASDARAHTRGESRRRRERGVRGWGLGECGRTLPDTQICH